MYKRAKEQLKNAADLIKSTNPSDKPMIRMYINDVCDSIVNNILIGCLIMHVHFTQTIKYYHHG